MFLLRNLPERQNLILRRLLYLVNPAAVVVDAVAAAAGDVEVGRSVATKLTAGGIPRSGHENSAVKFAVSATLSIERGCAVSDNQDNSVPARVTVVVEVAGDDEDAVSGVGAYVKASVNVNDFRIARGHVRWPASLSEIVRGSAVVIARRVQRIGNDRVGVLLN